MIYSAQPVVALLMLANILSCMSIDVHLPFAPQIVTEFKTTDQIIQFLLAMSVFLTTTTPLVWGPFSDRMGRKALFIPACLLMIFGQIGCAMAPSISILMLARFFQCLGAGAFLTVSMAIVCDLYIDKERSRKLAIIEMSLPIGLMIAPILGAEISAWYGWRMCYWLLALAQSLLMFAFIVYLPETLYIRSTASLRSLFGSLVRIGCARNFLPYALLRALVNACYMVFIAHAPFLLINGMGLSIRQFALYQGTLPIIYGLGLICTRPVIKYYSNDILLRCGMTGLGLFGIVVALALKGIIPTTPITTFLIMAFSAFISGAILIACAAISLGHGRNEAGVKSALLEFYIGALSAMVIYAASYSVDQSFYNVYSWTILCVIGAFFVWLITPSTKHNMPLYVDDEDALLSTHPVTTRDLTRDKRKNRVN